MKVLIADKFEEIGVNGLREAGCEIIHDPNLKDAELAQAIARTQCQVLIVRGTKVTADMFDASAHLALVIRAGAGVNTIDVTAASQRSVFVANCPGKNSVAVAELAIGLMLALDRRIVDACVELRGGSWNKKLYSQARGIKGRTLGIIGLGQIGRAVAARAQALEMHVVAWSRSLTDEEAERLGVRRMSSPEALAAESDVISVHLAAAPETKKRLNAAFFEAVRPGAYFINTARADVVDYDALARAVELKSLRVAMDVFEQEPATATGEIQDRIMRLPGIIIGTPHIGASTDQAQDAIAMETVRIVREYMRSGRVENCVNLCERTPANHILVVRHLNKPGVLAHTLNTISHAGINVEEMQNVILAGTEGAVAQIKLDGELAGDALADIRRNPHVLGVSQALING